MPFLTSVFPGLRNESNPGIPYFHDSDSPWHIFRSGEMGIQSQILQLLERGEESFIHPSAIIGENVQIEGPSYIGKNAEIRHGALLRKGSWICQGALVGHATEVKNSILLPGAKAPHFNYVGDSIVGFRANLGAGVKLSNVRNDRREVTLTLGDGSRVKSGLKKIGAMVGDGSQIGCNTVTNPGAIIPPNTMIPPNQTVTGWLGKIMS